MLAYAVKSMYVSTFSDEKANQPINQLIPKHASYIFIYTDTKRNRQGAHIPGTTPHLSGPPGLKHTWFGAVVYFTAKNMFGHAFT